MRDDWFAGAVLVEHGEHAPARGLVVGEDVHGAAAAGLLGGVEVELERVLGPVARLGEDAQSLEDDDGAGPVVVGAGAPGLDGAAGRVEVGPDDDCTDGQRGARRGGGGGGETCRDSSCCPGCAQ